LDVAILQRYLLDEVIQPRFAVAGEAGEGYTAIRMRLRRRWMGRYQIGLLLQATPLHALEELGSMGSNAAKEHVFLPKLGEGCYESVEVMSGAIQKSEGRNSKSERMTKSEMTNGEAGIALFFIRTSSLIRLRGSEFGLLQLRPDASSGD